MRNLLRPVIMIVLTVPAALALAETPAKTTAAPPTLPQPNAAPSGFIFPPPSGAPDGTVPGGTRGMSHTSGLTPAGAARSPTTTTKAPKKEPVKPVTTTPGSASTVP